MGHKPLSLVELMCALGEGWRAFVGTAEHGETFVAPGVSAGFSGEPSRDLNWIVAYGRGEVREGVLEAVARLRARGLPGVVYAASPVAGEVAEVADQVGLQHRGVLPLLCARGADVIRPEGSYDVRRVRDLDGVLAAGDVLGDAFELPPDWCKRLLGVGFASRDDAELYLSCSDGRPVAVAGVAQVGTVACIYAVGTRRAHRRRGAGAAAVSAALEQHLRRGAHWFGLLSALEAEPFYAGLGFVAVDHAAVWVIDAE